MHIVNQDAQKRLGVAILHICIWDSWEETDATQTHGEILLAHVNERVDHTIRCLACRQRHRGLRIQNRKLGKEEVGVETVFRLSMSTTLHTNMCGTTRDDRSIVAL